MSSIDNRIVVLSFDNQDFEKNVQTSLKTLDKLKTGLELDGASKGLSALSATAKSFSLNPIANAVESIQDRFSNLGIVGMTVIQNLTNTAVDFGKKLISSIAEPLASGGWRRALNLEQAEFMLHGLLDKTENGAKTIEDIMSSVNSAVKGTAYGLDEAAKVASQLVASGITDAGKMEYILRGIAGTAAMTGSSYQDMGDIFTTVAGNGKLMTEQLRQFSHRGLNVAAELAKQLNTTEEEVRDMVTKGKIDFETFSNAMAEAFGDHATKANETFTGSLANMKAALARIGAEVATPQLKNLRDIFNALRPLIDAVHEALMPFINLLNDKLAKAAERAVTFINGLTDSLTGVSKKVKEELTGTSDAVEESADTISKSADEIEEAAQKVLSGEYGTGEERRRQLEELGFSYEEVQNKVNELTGSEYRYEVQERELVTTTEELADNTAEVSDQVGSLNRELGKSTLYNFSRGISYLVSAFKEIASAGKNAFTKVFNATDFLQAIERISDKFRTFAVGLNMTRAEQKGLETIFKGVFTVIKNGLLFVGKLVEYAITIATGISGFVKKILNFIGVQEQLNEELGETSRRTKFIEALKAAFERLSGIIGELKSKFADMFAVVKQSEGFQKLHDALKNVLDIVKELAGKVVDKLTSKLQDFSKIEVDYSWVEKFGEWLGKAAGYLGDFIQCCVDGYEKVKEFFGQFKKLSEGEEFSEDGNSGLLGFLRQVKDAFSNFFSIFKTDDETADTVEEVNDVVETTGGALTVIKGFFQKIGDLLSGIDWGKLLLQIGKIALVIGALKTIFNLASMFKQAAGLLKNVSGLVKDVRTKISGDKISSFATKLKSIATGLALLAGALFLISQIPAEKMGSSIGILAGMLASMTGVIILLDKIKVDGNRVSKIATAFAALSASMVILSVALKSIASMSVGDIVKAELAIAGVIAIFAIASKALDATKKGSAAFIAMAAAVDALIPAMEVFGGMETTKVLKGGATVVALMTSMALISKLATKSAGGAASMLLMAIAIDALIPAILVFGNMKTEKIMKGGVAAVALMTSMALVSKLAQSAIRGSASMILMAAAVDALIPAMLVFGNMDAGKIIKGGAAIVSLMTSMALVSKIAESAMRGSASMILMSVAVDALIPAVLVFGNMETEKLVQAGVAIVALMTALSVASRLAQGSIGGVASMLAMTAPLTAAGIALALLSRYDWTGILAAGTALSGVMLSISVASRIAGTSLSGVETMLAMSVPLLAAAMALSALAGYEWESILAAGVALSAVMLAAAGAITILQAIPISGAITAAADFAIFIGALAGVLAALGALDQYTSFGELVSAGAGILGRLGKGLGSFAGGIIEGIGEGITNALINIASGLSTFGEEIQPFLDAMSNVNANVIEGVGNLAKALLIMCGTEFLDALTSGFGIFDSSAVRFGKTLVEFAPYLVDYSNIVADINQESVESSAKAALLLSEFAKNLPKEGGFISSFIGDNSLVQFAEELIPFGNALVDYSSSVKGNIDEESIASSARAATLITEFANTIPNEGGFLADFVGDNTLSQFAEGLIPFGEAIAKYSESVSGNIDEESVGASTRAATLITEFADTIPNEGGFLADFVGDNTLSQFAEGLIPFGEAISKYSGIVSGNIDENSVASSMRAAQMVADFADTIPNEGGLVAKITGDNDLGTFGAGLVAFGPALAKYSKAVEDVDASAVIASACAARMLANFAETVPKSGGFVGLVTGDNDIAQFGTQLQAFGPSLAAYSDSIQNVDQNAVETSVNAATMIAEFYEKTLPTSGGLVGLFEGNPLINFGKELAEFGPYMAEYSQAIAGNVNEAAVTASVNAATVLAEMYEKVLASGAEGGIVGLLKGNPLVAFGKELKDFAPYLVGYSDSVKNVSTYTLSQINKAMPELIEMTAAVNVASYDKIEDYGSALKDFGGKLKTYSSDISGVSTSKISSVVKAVYELIDVGNTMAYVDTVAMSNFGNALKNVGITGINDFLSAFNDSQSQAQSAVSSFVAAAAAGASDANVYYSWYNAGIYAINGMINGLNANSWAVYQTAYNIANSAAAAARNALMIRSPSRVMYEIGEYTIAGMVNAMSDKLVDVKAAGEEAGNTIVDAIAKPLEAIQNVIDSDLDLSPTITPVLDLSDVNSGVSSMNGLFGQTTISSTLGGSYGGNFFNSIMGLADRIAENQSSSESVVNAINDIRKDVVSLGNAMSRMQVMLDGQALVGQIIDPVDEALGERLTMRQRGLY